MYTWQVFNGLILVHHNNCAEDLKSWDTRIPMGFATEDILRGARHNPVLGQWNGRFCSMWMFA